MAVSSTQSLIDQDLQAILVSAGLDPIAAENFKVRELPSRLPDIDTVPMVCIAPAPAANFDQKPLGFERSLGRKYRREIAIIDACDGDYATFKDRYEGWLEAAANAIVWDAENALWRTKLPDVPTVWNLEVTEANSFDRSKFPEGYAYMSFIVEVWSNE